MSRRDNYRLTSFGALRYVRRTHELALRFRRKKPVSSSYPPEIRPLHHFHSTAHRPLVGRSAERSGRRRSPRGRSFRFEQLMWPTRPLLWASQPPAAWHPTTVAGSYFAAARAERAQSAQQSEGFGAMRTSHHGFQSARAGAPYPCGTPVQRIKALITPMRGPSLPSAVSGTLR